MVNKIQLASDLLDRVNGKGSRQFDVVLDPDQLNDGETKQLRQLLLHLLGSAPDSNLSLIVSSELVRLPGRPGIVRIRTSTGVT